jgi:hypothetical protein
LSVFEGINDSLRHENFFQFVSAGCLQFGSKLFFRLDDFGIFPISHEFEMELTFGGADFDLDFADSNKLFRLFVSHLFCV